ncbi:Low-density lipoprotein receptor domain class A [Oesophagostomum dentatum]|uniref:Low-density lipoprotein receptor domain class A n=1 Tax=Oesophagostomum dentatum TaxID=61180 RepID=A0A0B1T191_OESDE|nr:Low-density lipoprotein receptor domain class A [Oesophagostomum dentatum]
MGVLRNCRPGCPVKCGWCGVGRVPCDTRPRGVPCGRCVRIEDATKKCRDQKWKELCNVEGTIKCATTQNCVLPQWILDGKDDCGDGSDEEPCRLVECVTSSTADPETTPAETTTTVVATTKPRLRTTTTTVTTTTTTTKVLTLPSEIGESCEFGQFRCLSGECIDGAKVLNGVKDCFDNSDESEPLCQVFFFATASTFLGNQCLSFPKNERN